MEKGNLARPYKCILCIHTQIALSDQAENCKERSNKKRRVIHFQEKTTSSEYTTSQKYEIIGFLFKQSKREIFSIFLWSACVCTPDKGYYGNSNIIYFPPVCFLLLCAFFPFPAFVVVIFPCVFFPSVALLSAASHTWF